MENILRFYGRRHGKSLKPSRLYLMENLLPEIEIKRPEKGKIDLKTLFPFDPKEIWLEIGFGGGEHLAEQARLHKDIGFIGAEPFLNGVASLLTHLNGSHDVPFKKENPLIEATRQDNVRIYPDDIRPLFPFLKDESFHRIYSDTSEVRRLSAPLFV